MKRIIFLFVCFIILLAPAVLADTTVYQDLIDEITNKRAESVYDIELNAPFAKNKSGIREQIDIETGNVTVECNFFSFPAHGGQNFDFTAVYDLNRAKELDESINEETGENEPVEKTAYESSLYSLGIGWRISMPAVEIQGTRNKSRLYVHLPDGSVYIADTDSKSGLKDYPLDNLIFIAGSQTVGNVTYKYMLSYKDGTSYYFDSEGYLGAKTDRYMNSVTYTWEEYDEGKKRITGITDNSIRTVAISYDTDIVTISCNDRKYIIHRSVTDNGNYIIDSVTDPEGRKTEFKYYDAEISFNYYPDDLDDGTNTITALSRIIFPTGLTVCYEYDTHTKWLYEKEDGTIDYLKIKRRYDIEDNVRVNVLEYNYINEPGGYPKYKSDTIPASYEYHINEKDSFGNVVTYTYDGKHNPIRTYAVTEGYKSEESNVTFDSEYGLPVKALNTIYSDDGSFRQIISESTYDSRGNLLSYDYYDEEKGKYRVDYAYSGIYDICTYESRMQNDFVKLEVKRTLDSYSKNIETESVLKNGIAVKCDEYKYNFFGDVIYSGIQTDTDARLVTEYVYSGHMPYPSEVIQRSIVNPDGMAEDISVKYTYDSFGNVITQTLPNGAHKSYSYDKLGRLVSETLEDGSVRYTDYNDSDNIIVTTDARGTGLIYKYDDGGMLVSVTDPVTSEILTQREYDARKRLVTEKDAMGAVAVSSYDGRDRLVSYTVKDAEGKIYSNISLEYNDAENTVTTVESDGSRILRNIYTYDIFNQLTKQSLVTDEKEYTVYYEYDRMGNNISYTDESGNITRSEYDIFGNPTKLITPLGNTEEYTYDFYGNVTRHINGEGDITEFGYDRLGRQILVKRYFDGISSEYKTYYDSMGNVIKTVDENGNSVVYEYDERSFLTSTITYAETGKGIKTEYEYDSEGLVTKASYGDADDPLKRNNTYTFYDHLGNISKVVDNSGKTSYYEYNSAGLLINTKDPVGIETHYEYDVLGRQIRVSNGTDDDTLYSYNLFGELDKVTTGEKYAEYTYDERGYLIKSDTGITEDSYCYDDRGNVLEHITKDITAGTMKVSYEYDADSRTVSVNTPLGVQQLTYDAANRLIKSTNSQTGSVKEIVYDRRGLPVSAFSSLGGTVLSTENNVYDLKGNKLRSEENGYIRQYRYDGMDRLVSVSEDGKETLYEFDSFGNISKEHEITGLNLSTKQYYYDADNRLVLSEKDGKVVSYEYDANGNLTRRLSPASDVHYAYDGYNRLKQVIKADEVIFYEYNAEGFRDKKYTKEGMTRFLYDNASVSAEILPDGRVYSYYRGDGLIGSIDSKGNKLYYNQNTHGDVTAIYDSTGTILRDYRYNAYGKPQTIRYKGINQPYLAEWYAETTDIHNPFGYCGEYTDEETGFVYLRNRFYDPEIGRFTQEDPIRDGLNWYAYCAGNPVMFVDPWGLEDDKYVMVDYIGGKWGGVQIKEDGSTLVYIDNTKFEFSSVEFGCTTVIVAEQTAYTIEARKKGNHIIINSEFFKSMCPNVNESSIEHRPGDVFKTKEDAAIAWILTYNGKSIAENEEYASAIYNKRSGYTYTSPDKGNVANSGIPTAASQMKEYENKSGENVDLKGIIHSHGGNDSGYINEEFSDGDTSYQRTMFVPFYLATPGGSLLYRKKYNSTTKSIEKRGFFK